MTGAPDATIVLLLLNLALPAVCVVTQCSRSQRIEVNHILLFTTGFWLYWILPVSIGLMGALRDEPWMRLWYELFDAIQPSVLTTYLGVCLVSYMAFTAGSALSRHVIGPPDIDSPPQPFDRRLLVLFFVPALLAAGTFAFLLRSELFTGYRSIFEDFSFRGSFTAATLLLLALALVDLANRDRRIGAPPARLVSNWYLWVYFFFAVLVLSLGGRLYFVSSVLMLLVYQTVYIRRIRLIAFAGLAAMVVAFSGVIGLYREGSVAGAREMGVNLVAEFLFTSFSLIHFLGNASLELLRLPVFLLSDFLNLVPLFLFPAKAELLGSPEAAGFIVFAPGGALNSFMSFMINFGVLGTLVVLFLLGFGLNYLRARASSLLSRVVYVMLSGWLAFTFFRDPFSVSIVKNMFEFSILVPLVMVAGLELLTIVATVPRRAEPMPLGVARGE